MVLSCSVTVKTTSHHSMLTMHMQTLTSDMSLVLLNSAAHWTEVSYRLAVAGDAFKTSLYGTKVAVLCMGHKGQSWPGMQSRPHCMTQRLLCFAGISSIQGLAAVPV